MAQATPRPNVVLTGIMGSGKSTVAPLVAERLGYELVDTDAVIVERHGLIEDIWNDPDRGEPHFRTLEYEVACELHDTQGTVISTGGGMLLHAAAEAQLVTNGAHVFWLTAEPEELVRRVKADGGARPLLLKSDDPVRYMRALLRRRKRVYGRYPSIDTTDRSPQEVADEIVALAREQAPAG